jgi:hypothetical protein
LPTSKETKHNNGAVLLCSAGNNEDDKPGDDTILATVGEVDHLPCEEQFSFLNAGGIERLDEGSSHGQHKAVTGRGVPNWWILLDN